MSTFVYFLRHAQSEPNFNIHSEYWNLSAKGKLQAQMLAEILNAEKFSNVYSSPLIRCIDTIKPFCELSKNKLIPCDDLKEWKIVHSFSKDFGVIHRKSWKEKDFCLPNCESANVSKQRIIQAIQDLSKKNKDKNILLSSHSQVLALLINSINKQFTFFDHKKILSPDLWVFEVHKDQISIAEQSRETVKAVRSLSMQS